MLLGLMEKSQDPSFNKVVSVPTGCPFLLYFDTKTQCQVSFSHQEKVQKYEKAARVIKKYFL